MNRSLAFLGVGAVLALAYVAVALVLDWSGAMIGGIGLLLLFVYGLIATPLSLGPDRKTAEPRILGSYRMGGVSAGGEENMRVEVLLEPSAPLAPRGNGHLANTPL
jgi:hypothetical protein